MRMFSAVAVTVLGVSALGAVLSSPADTAPAPVPAIRAEAPQLSHAVDGLAVHDRALAARMTLSALEDAARQGIALNEPVPMHPAARDYSGI